MTDHGEVLNPEEFPTDSSARIHAFEQVCNNLRELSQYDRERVLDAAATIFDIDVDTLRRKPRPCV